MKVMMVLSALAPLMPLFAGGEASSFGPVGNAADQFRFLWDFKPDCYEEVRETGFNTILDSLGTQTYDMEGKEVPAVVLKRAAELFPKCERDRIGYIFQLWPERTKGFCEKYPRVLRDGTKYLKNPDIADPAAMEHMRRIIRPLAVWAATQPAVVGVETSTEVRDLSCPSFAPHALAAFKAATGLETPDAANGRAAPPWKNLKDLPADRVIDGTYPPFAYYKWFWQKGDGWNDLQTMIADEFRAAFAQRGRTLFAVYDPSQRQPPVYGSGGDVDFINHWSYVNPRPFAIAYTVAEQQAMALGRKGQGVFAMVQALVYRNQVSTTNRPSANLPSWPDDWPKSGYVTTPPDMMRAGIWSAFMRRTDGVGVHGWQCLYDCRKYGVSTNTIGYSYTNPETAKAVREEFERVGIPLGPFLRALPERAPEYLVVESGASQILQGSTPFNWSGIHFNYGVAATAASLSPGVIYEEELARSGVPASVKVLALAGCPVMTRGAVEAVRAFRARGGKVLATADLCPALGAPDAVLPPFETVTMEATSDHAEDVDLSKIGRISGAADDLSFWTTAGRLRQTVRKIYLPYSGVNVSHILTHVRSAGAAADCLFALNDKRTYGDYVGPWHLVMEKGVAHAGTVSVGRAAGAVYDLIEHRAVPFEVRDGRTYVPVSFPTTTGKAQFKLPAGTATVQVTNLADGRLERPSASSLP